MAGWKPDGTDTRDRRVDAWAELPDRAEVRRPGPLVLDQRPTRCCVADALAYALHARGWGCRSRLFLYWNGRVLEGQQGNDRGVAIRSALKGLASFGAPPESTWSFAPERVKLVPPAGVFEAARSSRGRLAYYRIEGTAQQKIQRTRYALASGAPVVIGTWVDPWFEADRVGRVWSAPARDNVSGGHAMCVLGYDGEIFFGPQSWGPQAHGSGQFRIHSSYLGWEGTRDVWTVVVPADVRA